MLNCKLTSTDARKELDIISKGLKSFMIDIDIFLKNENFSDESTGKFYINQTYQLIEAKYHNIILYKRILIGLDRITSILKGTDLIAITNFLEEISSKSSICPSPEKSKIDDLICKMKELSSKVENDLSVDQALEIAKDIYDLVIHKTSLIFYILSGIYTENFGKLTCGFSPLYFISNLIGDYEIIQNCLESISNANCNDYAKFISDCTHVISQKDDYINGAIKIFKPNQVKYTKKSKITSDNIQNNRSSNVHRVIIRRIIRHL